MFLKLENLNTRTYFLRCFCKIFEAKNLDKMHKQRVQNKGESYGWFVHECAENLPCSKVNGPEWTMHARSQKKWMARKGKCQSVKEAHVQPWIKCHSFGVEQSYQMGREGMKKDLWLFFPQGDFLTAPQPLFSIKIEKCHGANQSCYSKKSFI